MNDPRNDPRVRGSHSVRSHLEDVRRFHQKFGLLDGGTKPGLLTQRKMRERVECILEELMELCEASGLALTGNRTNDKLTVEIVQKEQDLPAQADALIDLEYFCHGTSVMLGLPQEKLWSDVQRANLSKVRGVGKRGHAFDCVKPEGWVGPRGEEILKAAGWDEEDKTERDDQ